MTNTSIYELAKSGEPNAIAKLLGKAFAKGGVKIAKCDRQGSTLRMLLIGEKIDTQQKHAIEFLQNQIRQLDIITINKITVYGQKPNENRPLWSEELNLISESIDQIDDFALEDDLANGSEGNDDFALEDDLADGSEGSVDMIRDLPPPLPKATKANSSQQKAAHNANYEKPFVSPSPLLKSSPRRKYVIKSKPALKPNSIILISILCAMSGIVGLIILIKAFSQEKNLDRFPRNIEVRVTHIYRHPEMSRLNNTVTIKTNEFDNVYVTLSDDKFKYCYPWKNYFEAQGEELPYYHEESDILCIEPRIHEWSGSRFLAQSYDDRNFAPLEYHVCEIKDISLYCFAMSKDSPSKALANPEAYPEYMFNESIFHWEQEEN